MCAVIASMGFLAAWLKDVRWEQGRRERNREEEMMDAALVTLYGFIWPFTMLIAIVWLMTRKHRPGPPEP
jgi:uncharacterized Tic20 family protein